MVAGKEEKKREEKGFAGLSSLASDVETMLRIPAEKTDGDGDPSNAGNPKGPVKGEVLLNPARGGAKNAKPNPHSAHQHLPRAPSRKLSDSTSGSSGSSGSSGRWVLGIAAIIAVVWVIDEVARTPPSSTSGPSSSTPAHSPPARSAAPSYSIAPAQLQAPSLPSRPEEAKPSIGQKTLFSLAQIRYCLAEDIRIDGARSAVNDYSGSDVDGFNALVGDYNSRCGTIHYGRGTLERARRDIEPYRSQLQAEGRSRFVRGTSLGSLSAPAPARPVEGTAAPAPTMSLGAPRLGPDATVRSIQQSLHELGYNAGPVDGLMGPRTRSAIMAFQHDNGLTATGIADKVLLSRMEEYPRNTTQPLASQPREARLSSFPNLSQVSQKEREGMERACRATREVSGPGAYENCLQRQLQSLNQSGGQPSLNHVTSAEREGIERACRATREVSGPGAYYNCLQRQLEKLQ